MYTLVTYMCSTDKGHIHVLDDESLIATHYTSPPIVHSMSVVPTYSSGGDENESHRHDYLDNDAPCNDVYVNDVCCSGDDTLVSGSSIPPCETLTSPTTTLRPPVVESGGSSPERIVYKRLTQSNRKIDTSIHPAIRVEITRLTRIFMGWIPPDTRLSERNKVELTDTQLQAVLYAREKHVTPVQIAGVLGISVYRVHHVLKHAKTMRKRRIMESKRIAPLNGYVTVNPPQGQPIVIHAEPILPSSEPLAAHIQKRLLVEDISPRT